MDERMGASFFWIAVLVGYYLAYSIRSGSKTQDVFKSLLGIGGLASIPTAATSFKLTADQLPGLLSTWGVGAVSGFGSYFVLGLILSGLYSRFYKQNQAIGGWALFAEIASKLMLGEDIRPKPQGPAPSAQAQTPPLPATVSKAAG